MTTIVIADDHDVVRRGLQLMLESQPDFKIVGEAGTGLRAAELVERLRPDVLVVDVVMPDLNGLEVVRRAARASPKTRVVVLSMYSNEAYAVGALRAGAMAYVLKSGESKEVIRAIREAIAGNEYLSPPLSRYVLEDYVRRTKSADADPYDTLTPREREVLHMTAQGLTLAQIAERQGVSPRTPEAHRTNIMRKLGLHTTSDLIRYAVQRGILPPESQGHQE